MVWYILAAAGGLSSSIFNFTNRHVLKTNGDSTSYSWWFEFFRTFIFLLLFIFGFKNTFPLDKTHLYLLLLIGLVEFVTIFIYMRMHAKNDLSVSSIVIQLRTVWIPILSFIFLREVLLVHEYFGIFLVFMGQIFVVSPRKFKDDSGVKYAFFASIFTAFNTVIMKQSLEYYSIPVTVAAMGIPTIIIYPFIMKGRLSRIIKIGKLVGKKIFIAASFNSLAMFLLALALSMESAGKVSAVYQGLTIVTVLSGIVFLHERKNIMQKITGAILVVLGVILLV